jgi:EAL domain-containing protein (putative c-di-GMP-specific phosphodiesterase class I)
MSKVWTEWAAMTLLGVALSVSLYILRQMRRRLRESEVSVARAEAEWVQALDYAEDAMYLIDLDDFLEFVMAQIHQSGVDPAHITFEITETAAVANFS